MVIPRNWTRYQEEGFHRVVNNMAHIWRACDLVVYGEAMENFEYGLRHYSINNIRVENSGTYIYRFYPMGDDFPYRYRSEFTRLEGMLIDRKYHTYWADPQEDNPRLHVDEDPRTVPAINPASRVGIENKNLDMFDSEQCRMDDGVAWFKVRLIQLTILGMEDVLLC
jgi:hypothetical protein